MLAALLTVPAVAWGMVPVPTGAGPSAAYYCPQPGRAAKAVSLAAPGFALASGDVMTVHYEVAVVNSTTASFSYAVRVPSIFALFPLANGSTLTFYIPVKSLTLTNTSWSDPSLATKSKTMTTAWMFSGATALMTTEIIAIMVDAPRGTMELGFRWQWMVTFASNGTTVASAWSRVTANGSSPTIFYPAPYVALDGTSNRTAAIGSYFTATVSGATSATVFRSELEYASTGNVVRSNHTNTPAGSQSSVNVTIQILGTSGPFAPSVLLDHIHDDCGALLYSITVTSVYASSADVHVVVQPAACGPVVVNGTTVASGGVTTMVPSGVSATISAGPCTAHTFSGWSTTSGLSVNGTANATASMIVSASGTLTARFA